MKKRSLGNSSERRKKNQQKQRGRPESNLSKKGEAPEEGAGGGQIRHSKEYPFVYR